MNSRLQTFTFFMLSVFILGNILILAGNMLVPFIVALLLWHLLNTMAVMTRKIPYIGSYIPETLSLLIALIVLFFVLFELAGIITNNVNEVIMVAPKYQKNFMDILSGIDKRFNIKALVYMNDWVQSINFRNILVNVYGVFTTITSNALLIALYLGFLFLEQRVMRKKFTALFPDKNNLKLASDIISQIVSDTQTYLGIKTAMSLITATASWLIMKAVGLDFAEFWALLIFFLNFIPNIGSIIATLFPAVLALVQFKAAPLPFTLITGGIIVVQFIVGNLIEPRFLGNSLNLSPLVILIALAVWGQLWGVLGMFLSVPITVMMMIIFSHFEKTHAFAILLSQNGQIKER